MTRLGRIVNSARRKMQDRSLARRMKKLVKQWQKLAAGLNGTTEASNASTPSPTKPMVNNKPIVGALPSKHSNAFLHETIPKANNITASLIMPESHLPCTMATPTSFLSQPLPSFRSTFVPESSLGSNRSTISQPPDFLDQTRPINLHASQVNGQNNDLVISLPLTRITKQQKEQQREQQKQQQTEQQREQQKQQQTEQDITSLIVKVPLQLITLPWERHVTPPVLPPQPSPLSQPVELIVSIRLSLFKSIAVNCEFDRTKQVPPSIENTSTILCKRESLSNSKEKKESCRHQGHVTSVGKTIHPAAPSGRLKGYDELSESHEVGVEGCVGSDGLWYGWEDCIPSEGEMVSIYPYVYIDGLTGYEKEQTWSSLDTEELTNSILYS